MLWFYEEEMLVKVNKRPKYEMEYPTVRWVQGSLESINISLKDTGDTSVSLRYSRE